MIPVTIERAKCADLCVIHAFASQQARGAPGALSLEDRLTFLKSVLCGRGGGFILMAHHGGSGLVGMLACELTWGLKNHRPSANFSSLFVAKGAPLRTALLLIKEAGKLCREREVEQIFVVTTTENPHPAYEALGAKLAYQVYVADVDEGLRRLEKRKV